MKYVSKIQRAVTKRVIEVMDILIASGDVKNKKAFAEEIKFPYYAFLRLEKNDNVSINIDALYYLSIKFDINLDFLITGEGDPFSKRRNLSSSQASSQNA